MQEEHLLQTMLDARHLLSASLWPILRDHHAIEDIVQNTIIKAFVARETLLTPVEVVAWARVTARNEALNYLQRQRSRVTPLDDDVLDRLYEDWNQVEPELVRTRVEALKDCLEELPPRSQEIISLRYQAEWDGKRMADHFRMSVDALYKATQRIHDALRRCVERRLKEALP